jgi:hypothetical protein
MKNGIAKSVLSSDWNTERWATYGMNRLIFPIRRVTPVSDRTQHPIVVVFDLGAIRQP